MNTAIRAIVTLLVVSAVACAESNVPPPPPDRVIETVAHHVKEFDADDNPIDDPGSPGEIKAIQYTASYLRSLGLKTSIQSVPLVQMIPTAATAEVHGPKGEIIKTDATGEDFIVWPGQQLEQVTLDAPIVFAGYGIVSPEYNRDDFKRVDVAGKIVLVMEGSPHTGENDDLGALGETYYGTRFYKFDEAARHGAAAVLLIHSGLAAPWEDIQQESTGSTLAIEAPTARQTKANPKAQVEGWLSGPAAQKLFGVAGLDASTLYEQAHELAFEPVAIPGVRATFNMTSRFARLTSQDVIAVLQGQTDEYMIVAGRWNRIDPAAWAQTIVAERAAPGKQAQSMAATTVAAPPPVLDDDGSGAATVMEAAARLAGERRRPLRTIVFMVTTALKPGILGLEYYVEHPPPALPLDKLTAMIFLDRADLQGVSQRVGKIGTASDGALAQITREASIEQGRLVELDQSQEKRFYYKFGQTALAAEGVRVIYLTTRPDEGKTGHLLRRVARRDDVVGVVETKAPVPTAFHDPTRDAALLATITSRVANATNWPPRIEPEVVPH